MLHILKQLNEEDYPSFIPLEFSRFFSPVKEHLPQLSHGVLSFSIDQPFQGALQIKGVHGADIVLASPALSQADGHYLVGKIEEDGETASPVLAMHTADCLALAFTLQFGSFFLGALVHAGWRGFSQGIIQNALATFLFEAERAGFAKEEALQHLKVTICPAIFGVSYECGDDVKKALNEHASNLSFRYSSFAQVDEIFQVCMNVTQHAHKIFPDLQLLACCELFASGLTLSNIAVIRENTYTHPVLYSYRAGTQRGEGLEKRNFTHLKFPAGFELARGN